MSKTFIIAEAALTWLHGGLEAAYRSIEAAKACGADAWKTQWTSDHEAMEMRRGVERGKYKRLQWGEEALSKLKEKCDAVGVEFMCTAFLPKDVPIIAPLVKRFKVSAFESQDTELIIKCMRPPAWKGHEVIVSLNPGKMVPNHLDAAGCVKRLHCLSVYPCPPELLRLHTGMTMHHGFSDHTRSALSGAIAVAAGAQYLEKHVKLDSTPHDDPDYGHSLDLEEPGHFGFQAYVRNVREAEVML